MPYLTILIIIAFAVFFYRAAEFEDESVFIWCGLSVTISFITFFWLGWGWLGCSFGQAGLFVGITILRMFRKE
jgi:hypothetical protein